MPVIASSTPIRQAKEALGTDVNYFFNVDPISIWLTNEKALKPGLAEIVKMVGEEYIKARPGR